MEKQSLSMGSNIVYLEGSLFTSIYKEIKISKKRESPFWIFWPYWLVQAAPLALTVSVPFIQRVNGYSGMPYHMCGVINELVGVINNFIVSYHGMQLAAQDMAPEWWNLMWSDGIAWRPCLMFSCSTSTHALGFNNRLSESVEWHYPVGRTPNM